MLRNAGDSEANDTFRAMEEETIGCPESPSLRNIRTQVSSSDLLSAIAPSVQLMSESVNGILDEKDPVYRDHDKLALATKKQIKQEEEQVRAEKLVDNPSFGSEAKAGREEPVTLPPNLPQVKEKVVASGDSGDQSNDDKAIGSQTISKMKIGHIQRRLPRVPRPPPKPSARSQAGTKTNLSIRICPTPPPPPPGAPRAPPSQSGAPRPPPPPSGAPRPPPPSAGAPRSSPLAPGAPRLPPPQPGGPPPPLQLTGSLPRGAGTGDKVQRATELIEFYQTLMKREARQDKPSSFSSGTDASAAKSDMVGEIESKSAYLLAVKDDVETQGDFVQSLATEVRAASFTDVEDLVAFVNWLDEELSFLADERAVLKHFDWPEAKADALREAACKYQDLVKLEKETINFVDDPNLRCEAALLKMCKLLQKVEDTIYTLLRTRDKSILLYKESGVPVNWLLDSGVVGKVKLSSLRLARNYMKRVISELDALGGTRKQQNREFCLLQGVRFAFRVHQFAGGFDAETRKAFQELRSSF